MLADLGGGGAGNMGFEPMDFFYELDNNDQAVPANTPDFVTWSKTYTAGLMGLVAARLTEKFERPSIVFSESWDGTIRGSARSIPGVSIIDIFSDPRVSRYLTRHGGHHAAGGCSSTVLQAPRLREAFMEVAEEKQRGRERQVVEADTDALLSELTPALVRDLDHLGPFGAKNPGPKLFLRRVRMSRPRVTRGENLEFQLGSHEPLVTAIIWRQTVHHAVRDGAVVDVIARPTINEYKGQKTVQLSVFGIEET